MKNRISIKVIALIICLIGFFALLYIVFGLIEGYVGKTKDNWNSDDEFSYSDYPGEQIYYESEWYVPNESVESILILGIDKKSDGSEKRQNSEQADFLALFIWNQDKKSYRILYLNRDTIAEISQTDAFGEEYGTIKAQLALAHAYGDEEKVRCRNTVNTVEKLLYGVNIDHYISLTMDAVPVLNDSVGGVTLQLMDDFTALDETFVKDAVVTLVGEQALAYVQERGALEDSSNIHRMERQRQYISAWLEKARNMDSEAILDSVLTASDYIVSDCTVDQLSRFAEKLESYTNEGTDTLDGESVKGIEYMEYHVDEKALQALVVELFYKLRD